MNIKIILLCAAVCLNAFTYAQVGMSKQKDVLEIQKRTLIVVTEEENPKLTGKLEGDVLAQYKQDIIDYNRDIKEAVDGFWKFSTKIEYKTRAEVEQLTKAKSKDYAYIEYNKFTVNCANASAYKSTYQFKSNKGGMVLMGGDYVETQLNIRLSDENPLAPPIFGVRMPSPYPNKADLVYAIKAIQLQLNYKVTGIKDMEINGYFKDNGKKLQSMTLLVDEYNTDLKIEDIKKAYGFPVELVKKDKIDNAILTSDEKSAFVIVIPYSSGSYSFEIFSAKDCSEMGRTTPDQSTGVSVGGGIGGGLGTGLDMAKDASKSKLKKDHFKIFGKNAK